MAGSHNCGSGGDKIEKEIVWSQCCKWQSSHCTVERLARIILGLGGGEGGWEGDRKVETINLPPYIFILGQVQFILDLFIVKVGWIHKMDDLCLLGFFHALHIRGIMQLTLSQMLRVNNCKFIQTLKTSPRANPFYYLLCNTYSQVLLPKLWQPF